jgi:Protein of unknown function (DUF1320)
MTTFAGRYIKEPSDLQTVCTEADIIAVCDDKAGARDILTFADLDSDVEADIALVMNSLIEPEEALVEGYARRRGYAVPLSPIDAEVKSIVARLVWISMRQRSHALTSSAAEADRKTIRDGSLNDIATGKLVLTALMDTIDTPADSVVYRISDGHSRDTGGAVMGSSTITRNSRKSLEGW